MEKSLGLRDINSQNMSIGNLYLNTKTTLCFSDLIEGGFMGNLAGQVLSKHFFFRKIRIIKLQF